MNDLMMQSGGNSRDECSGQVCVPPGFRFHPTDEELLYYYLKKKVCYEAIDLDVIREVDLNKLEPWDLKEKCRIGTGPQNEWYFFSHKDKKYPTGSRTNRATAAGFWKATGRDKPIYHHLTNSSSSSSSMMSRRIGMRKTLVFYTGRAPHGQKTDWIMHEYRLIIDSNNTTTQIPTTNHHPLLEEDGWVVCRVFRKKNHSRCLPPEISSHDEHQDDECLAVHGNDIMINRGSCASSELLAQHHTLQEAEVSAAVANNNTDNSNNSFGYQQLWDIGSNNYMHLPQLLSTESGTPSHRHVTSPFQLSPALMSARMSNMETFLSRPLPYSQDHHHNKLNNNNNNNNNNNIVGGAAGDWAFLGKLLASNHQATEEDNVGGDQTKYCNLLLSHAAENIMNMQHHQVSSSTSTTQPCSFPLHHLHNAFEP